MAVVRVEICGDGVVVLVRCAVFHIGVLHRDVTWNKQIIEEFQEFNFTWSVVVSSIKIVQVLPNWFLVWFALPPPPFDNADDQNDRDDQSNYSADGDPGVQEIIFDEEVNYGVVILVVRRSSSLESR